MGKWGSDVGTVVEQYFDLLLELESLLGRPVDLIEPGAVRNPYFRQSLRASGQVLYDAA